MTTTGARALSEWERLRSAGNRWPVIVGGDDDLRMMAEAFGYNSEAGNKGIPDILATAQSQSFPDALKAWQSEEGYEEVEEPLGDWPEGPAVPAPGLTVAKNILTDAFLPKVHIVLVPTDKSWEAPAYLKWGGWNACPPPEYHVAALSSWYERFGAELVGLSGDVINLKIARPPRQKDEAMQIAREQYLYCPDIVDQGTGDISALAKSLIGVNWWFFWWD